LKTKIIFILLLFIVLPKIIEAQQMHGIYDTIPVTAWVVNGDTIPYIWIETILVKAQAPAWAKDLNRRKKSGEYDREYQILRYNVRKVYPYAIMAAYVMHDIDSVMSKLYSKMAKADYKERRENDLNARFKTELTDLTITQGQILVKLINRQTGKSVYEIVKNLKGGFTAIFSQGMARLFDNNLKNIYDANGQDAVIEGIIKEIEAGGTFKIDKI
jgi:Domain of unknown function (DUF4294)